MKHPKSFRRAETCPYGGLRSHWKLQKILDTTSRRTIRPPKAHFNASNGNLHPQHFLAQNTLPCRNHQCFG